MTNCPHLWVLASDKYFDLGWIYAMLKWEGAPYFPVRCHCCMIYKDFSQAEWEKHIQEKLSD